jgi:hypothetical protein
VSMEKDLQTNRSGAPCLGPAPGERYVPVARWLGREEMDPEGAAGSRRA